MNLWELLPTKKVTAFVLGGALAIVILWLLVDVFNVLDEWPEAWIVGAWVVILGFILAWIVPESAWDRVGEHTEV